MQKQIGSSCQMSFGLLKPINRADLGFGHYPGLGEATKPFSEVDWRDPPAQYPPPALLISLANLGRADI